MGARGPKPKPTALRVLEGNPSHRPLPQNEPKPAADAVKCPSWISKDAKREWRRLAPALISMGILTNNDVQAFAAYCQCYSNWRQATISMMENDLVTTTESGYRQQSPYISIASNALAQMRQFAGEFGLTPAARTRINAGSSDAKKIEEDPMEQLLASKWK